MSLYTYNSKSYCLLILIWNYVPKQPVKTHNKMHYWGGMRGQFLKYLKQIILNVNWKTPGRAPLSDLRSEDKDKWLIWVWWEHLSCNVCQTCKRVKEERGVIKKHISRHLLYDYRHYKSEMLSHCYLLAILYIFSLPMTEVRSPGSQWEARRVVGDTGLMCCGHSQLMEDSRSNHCYQHVAHYLYTRPAQCWPQSRGPPCVGGGQQPEPLLLQPLPLVLLCVGGAEGWQAVWAEGQARVRPGQTLRGGGAIHDIRSVTSSENNQTAHQPEWLWKSINWNK